MLRKFALGTVLALAAGVTVGCDSGATKPGDKNATGKSNMQANAAKERSDAFEKAGNKASEATAKAVEKGKEVAEKGTAAVKEGADKVAEALRTSTLAPITEKLKAITDKVNEMKGDAGTKAKASLADLTKLVEGFKTAPADKLKDLVQPLKDKFAEVLKLVGLS